jgi:acetoin utilization protein AcuC
LKTSLIFSEELSRFNYGKDHPFKPIRAQKTMELCERYNLLDRPWISLRRPRMALREELCLFHADEYISALERVEKGEFEPGMLAYGLGTEDNPLLRGIYTWCLGTTGGTLAGIELLEQGYERVFNLLGGFHHAGAAMAEGFCYVNDICVAIRKLLREGKTRVAYVDIDAHHGNGVQDAFYSDDRVLVVSIHESGKTLYPWSGFETEIGEGKGRGYTVNIPLAKGTDDEIYREVIDEILRPVLDAFSPELVIAQIGADTLISDPLTHLRLTNNAYRTAVHALHQLSPRLLALGGGGYDIYRTSRCWTLAWCEMNEIDPEDTYAGIVGGMMFGPEMEMGSLYDRPVLTTGEMKDAAWGEVRAVCQYIRKTVFPILGIR